MIPLLWDLGGENKLPAESNGSIILDNNKWYSGWWLGHPIPKNMTSSIGMMFETQYFWENKIDGNHSPPTSYWYVAIWRNVGHRRLNLSSSIFAPWHDMAWGRTTTVELLGFHQGLVHLPVRTGPSLAEVYISLLESVSMCISYGYFNAISISWLCRTSKN